MTLPVIPKKSFTIKNKWTPKQGINLYPFSMGDESLFLQVLGIDGDTIEEKDMFDVLEQVINNSVVNPDDSTNPLSWPTFLLEYVFIQQRINSIGNTIDFIHECSNCGHEDPLTVDLSQVTIKEFKDFKQNFKVDESIGFTMRYPTLLDFKEHGLTDKAIITACLDKVYEDDTVYDGSAYTHEEKERFLAPLPLMMKKDLVTEFFMKLPHIEHTHNDQCSKCGTKKTFRFTRLNQFFI